MKQNDAVFQAVCAVLKVDGFDGVVDLSKEERETVITIVTEGIIAGKVDFSAEARIKYDTPQRIKMYTTGMVSNHLRKDKRLNGGEKYEIKNPGSRSKKDPQLEALKLLAQQYDEGSEPWTEINKAITERQAQLDAIKKPTVTINADAIPEHLRHLLSK